MSAGGANGSDRGSNPGESIPPFSASGALCERTARRKNVGEKASPRFARARTTNTRSTCSLCRRVHSYVFASDSIVVSSFSVRDITTVWATSSNVGSHSSVISENSLPTITLVLK